MSSHAPDSAAPFTPASEVPVWEAVLLSAMAGGMGWGIRGQYGHETGAMMAGLLVGLVLVLRFCPGAPPLVAVRAVAWGALAMGFGGSMTYGQTVGLTHDPELVGNWPALRWGMLGLSIKGALWIGFSGVFLGMGLGGVRYRAREVVLVLSGMLGLCWVGLHALNRPFDPANHVLPHFYFSADWHWRPGATLKPRPEVWGAYLFAFLGLITYCGFVRRDRLARNLGLWAALGGAIGFPLGQCIQAYHAWNPEVFRTGIWTQLGAAMNWWNWMETTFGTTMGACMGLGLWLNRRHIALSREALPDPLPVAVETGLLALHAALLAWVEFLPGPVIDRLYDFGLLEGFLPVVLVAAGRFTPFVIVLPIIALPIAGKTLRELVYEQPVIPALPGWLIYFAIPMVSASALAWILAVRAKQQRPARDLLAPALLFATWLYWGLNFGFFRFPWPWQPWTVRTPNALVYTLCAAGLTWAAISARRTRLPR